MMRRAIKLCLPLIVLALSPAVAYADAGTPLVWAGAFHLFIGNAIIGIAEGLILARFFRPKRAGCIPIMIAANYFSAWVGSVFVCSALLGKLDLDLYNARWRFWCVVAITYLLTLLLEWPFVALCLRKTEGWFRKSIWGSLVVQSASYFVLFGCYWAVSVATRYATDLAVVRPSAISLPKGATLYYIAENQHGVLAWDLGREETRKICELTSSQSHERLFLRESGAAAGRWDLIVGPEPTTRPWIEPRVPSPSDRIVSANLACAVAVPPDVGLGDVGEFPRFRADKSGWKFQFNGRDGLWGENPKDGRTLDLPLDEIFDWWDVHDPTQLPGGQVVFQLGSNQICILDPNERKIARLAKGRWPVITMKDSQP